MSGKSFFWTIIFIFIIIPALAGSTFFWWWNQVLMPVDPTDDTYQAIVIPDNQGAAAMGSLLQDEGLIRNQLAFRIYVKKMGWDRSLKPGRYQFSRSQSLEDIVLNLKEGALQDFWVTLPEGKRREEIALIISRAFSDNGLSFSIPDFLDLTQAKEGFLFPDTYLIPRTAQARDVVALLENTFNQKITPDHQAQARRLGLSMNEIITLASLVEREAKFDEDRPKIAGVLLNRLDIDMLLQVDATVQYGVGSAACQSQVTSDCNWWPIIQDTKYGSPYNTYLSPGLPPGPICNPGLAVIDAVLQADQHDYLFYLSEDSGETHYAETLEEHNQNIQRYLQ